MGWRGTFFVVTWVSSKVTFIFHEIIQLCTVCTHERLVCVALGGDDLDGSDDMPEFLLRHQGPCIQRDWERRTWAGVGAVSGASSEGRHARE